MSIDKDVKPQELFVHWWQICKLAQPLWKTVWHSLVKLKIHISYYTAFSLLDIL